MRSDPILATYLHQLQETDVVKEKQTKEKASAKTARVEDMDTDEAGAAMGRVQQVDLDDLAFHQGSHLMANKRCHLPDGSFRKQKKGEKRWTVTMLLNDETAHVDTDDDLHEVDI